MTAPFWTFCIGGKSQVVAGKRNPNRDVEAGVEEVAGNPGVVRRQPPRRHPPEPAANHAGTTDRAVWARVDDLVSFVSTPTPPSQAGRRPVRHQVPGFENRSTLENHVINIGEYIIRLTSPANQGSAGSAPGPSIQEAPSP